jgi:DNA polymerase (family 10)
VGGAAAGLLHRRFDQLAALAALRGDAAQAALFREASSLVQARHLTSDAALDAFLDAPPPSDIDPALFQRLRHLTDTPGWVLLESAVADLPADLRWLFESGATTLDQVLLLHDALGVTAAADLSAAIGRGAIAGIPGLDADVARAIAAALPTLRASRPRVPLGRAVAVVEPLLSHLAAQPGVAWAQPAGSLRRGEETVGDVEIVAPAAAPSALFDAIVCRPEIARTLHQGPRKLYVMIDRVQVGIRCPSPECGGAALLHLTGTRGHWEGLGQMAAERGWTLAPEGLIRGPDAPRLGASEDEIYQALELAVVPAEIRGSGEELAAARSGTLPALVARADIRGDLHMHTEWSDGRDSVQAMVEAAVALGYEYVAITDHSQHSAAARNLTVDGVARQAEEIAAVRERYPQIRILHGCEVDILPDGRLDFEDRVLERFDVVLASLHERAGQEPDRLLRRYRGAMRHPLVTIITHPSNRLVPYRPGYDIDYDRLFALAVETGTILEIDGAPVHLDLAGALARRAVAAGVTVAIDSDSHRAELLDRQMTLGVMTARRGWVEPRHVLNTRSFDEIRAVVASKRGR